MTTSPDELIVRDTGPILHLTLARPTRRNALSRSLVAALRDAFTAIEEGGETRAVVLAGDGPVFCAGGDIDEFIDAVATGHSRADAAGIAGLLAAMTACPAPIVARIHGAAVGGGVGLVCASDIAIAAEGTRFSLSEARLGLVPAVISPYVIAALGPREATAQMLLAAPFGVEDALRCGLIHQAVPSDQLDAAIDEAIGCLLHGAPGALATIKRLPRLLTGANPTAARTITTELLVERLGSAEGQEGLRAFRQKREPAWAPKGQTS